MSEEKRGFYYSNGQIWDTGETPICTYFTVHDGCNEYAKYETPFTGLNICDAPACAVMLAKENFEPIQFMVVDPETGDEIEENKEEV